jgi:hypothetical protein
MFVNSGTRGNKTELLRSLPAFPPLHKTRDTPNRVNREVPKILRHEQLAFVKER